MPASSAPSSQKHKHHTPWLPLRIMGKPAAVTILVVGILGSYFASQFAKEQAQRSAIESFEIEAQKLQNTIQNHIDVHTNALYSVQGFFAASDSVERGEWVAFMNGLNVRKRFSGIYAMYYVERVTQEQKRAFTERVRGDTSINSNGYSRFSVIPDGNRDEYYVINFTEPFEKSVIHGTDLRTDNDQRSFLERARDTGELATTDRVKLADGTSAFVAFLPIYRNGAKHETEEQRRTALKGFVAATFKLDDLLTPLLSYDQGAINLITFENEIIGGVDKDIFEDNGISAQEKAFAITKQLSLSVGGRTWTLELRANPAFLSGSTTSLPLTVLIAGILISFALFGMIYALASSHMNALRLAGRMTSELGKFQLAVENAINHVMITDQEGIILYANPAVLKTTGYTKEEIIGKNPKMWGGLMPEEFYRDMWHTIKNLRKPYERELQNKRKNGEIYEAFVHISPIEDKAGRLLGFVGLEEDITERKRIDAAKSEFVSLASHQLRTPLTAMKLALETLQKGIGGKIPEQHQTLIAKGLEYAHHMADTIHIMLTVSHIEAGKVLPACIQLHPCDLINEVMQEFLMQHQGREIKTETKCPQQINLETDPKLLREVLITLISNAFKYTPDKGRVSVAAEQKGDNIQFVVTDTGFGIPLNEQERVFQKFFRGKNILKRQTDGTGLGLYLAHSLTKLLGGNLSFTSKENEGTTFTLTLPLTPPIHGTQDSHS